MLYLIQVSLYTAILYAVYVLFLKDKSQHNWSRAYLLVNMLLPIVLPFIRIPSFGKVTNAGAEVVLPVVTVGQQVAAQINTISILPILYVAVCCTLLGYFIAQVVQMVLFIKRHYKEDKGDISLLRNTMLGPGSWLNNVFVPGEEVDEAILQHETAHVRLKHSYDIIFLSLLRCVFWPNVVLWMIGKELKIVHEFQADSYAGQDRETYSQKLLDKIFHTKHFSVSHTFFHHPIKRRLMMLQNNRNSPVKSKVLFTSLLLITSMLYLQCSKETVEPLTVKFDIPKDMDENGVYKIVDKMPEFNGDFVQYLSQHIKYPKDAQDRKVEGRVMLKFVVDEQGNISNVRILKSPDESLSKAALDVVENMPKWKPGESKGEKVKVYFTLPISFRLPGEVPAAAKAVE